MVQNATFSLVAWRNLQIVVGIIVIKRQERRSVAMDMVARIAA